MNRKAATPTTQKMGREWVDNDHHKRTQKERKNYYIIRSSVSNIPLEVGKQKKNLKRTKTPCGEYRYYYT